MGTFSYPLLVLKHKVRENEKCKSTIESLRDKVLEAQAKRTRKGGKIQRRAVHIQNSGHPLKKTRPGARYLMKGRVCRKPGSSNVTVSKINTLKKLIPNSESVGIDGLLRETSAYILSLQTRVQIMQIMVKVLTDSDE